MVGMDGAIMASQTYPTRTRSTNSDMGGAIPLSRQISRQVSIYDHSWEATSDDDDDGTLGTQQYEVVLASETKNGSKLKRLLCFSGCVVLVLVVVLACYFGTRKSEPAQAATFANDLEQQLPYPTCESGNVGPRIRHQPRLEILITGISDTPDSNQKRALEKDLADGFNGEAGGCSDGMYILVLAILSLDLCHVSSLLLETVQNLKDS